MRILNGRYSSDTNNGEEFRMAEDCGFVPEGEDTYTFNLPEGYQFHSQLEPNQSTTLSVTDPSGKEIVHWNSGTFISCFILGAGVGMMVTSFARNAKIGGLAASLASKGCTYAVNRTYEDGDTYVPAC